MPNQSCYVIANQPLSRIIQLILPLSLLESQPSPMIPRVALALPRDVTQIAPATASSRCSDGDCGGGCYSGLCAICGAILELQLAKPQLAPAKPVGRLKRGKAARRECKPHFARLLRHESASTIHPSLLPVCAISTPSLSRRSIAANSGLLHSILLCQR